MPLRDEHHQRMKHTLTSLLDNALPSIRTDIPLRWVPTSFNPEDAELRSFPIPRYAPWDTLAAFLTEHGSHGVVGRLPTFWQMGFALYRATRTAHVPLFTNEPQNTPLGAVAIRDAHLDTIVTEATDAHVFARYCESRSIPQPRLWYLLHRIDALADTSLEHFAPEAIVAHEVYLCPGIRLLEQCTALQKESPALFHLDNTYTWELTAHTSLISATDVPIPFTQFDIGIVLTEHGVCPCGKTRYTRVV